MPAPNGGKASDWTRPFPNNRRAANYQRVCTNQAMGTPAEYFPRVGGKPAHISSQGKEAVGATHDTLPQVIKASAIYCKNIFTLFTTII